MRTIQYESHATHEFAWNPEGTLARWTDPNADYERVFSYDEEGHLTKIERDNGQSVQTAYEYTYTGDGIRHMKKDHLANKEYRYGCSIDCGGTPLRVYERTLGSQGSWNNYEDYMNSPTFVWYNHSGGGSSDYAWLPGHWMSDQEPPGEGSMFYQDAFGVQVVAGDFDPQQEPPENRLPDYAMQDLLDNLWLYLPKIRIGQRIGYWPHPSEIFAPPPPPPAPPPIPPATPPPAPSSPVGGLPGIGIGQPGGSQGGGEVEIPAWLVGLIVIVTDPPHSSRGGLCDYICKYELTTEPWHTYCETLCKQISNEGCDWLFKHCGKMTGKARDVCMTIYLGVCHGR